MQINLLRGKIKNKEATFKENRERIQTEPRAFKKKTKNEKVAAKTTH